MHKDTHTHTRPPPTHTRPHPCRPLYLHGCIHMLISIHTDGPLGFCVPTHIYRQMDNTNTPLLHSHCRWAMGGLSKTLGSTVSHEPGQQHPLRLSTKGPRKCLPLVTTPRPLLSPLAAMAMAYHPCHPRHRNAFPGVQLDSGQTVSRH